MHDAPSPVTFLAHVARLPQRGMPVVIEADEKARLALARLHGLEAVRAFRAELLVERWRRDGVRVSGRVSASVVQRCIVTLEPVEAMIDEGVEITLLPEQSHLVRIPEGGEMVLDAEGADIPDTFDGESIDIGALAEEYFELAIDAYPRKAGAAVAPVADGQPEKEPSPFAKLANWKPKG